MSKVKSKVILNVLSQRVDEIASQLLRAIEKDNKMEALRLVSELGSRNQTMNNAIADDDTELALEAVSCSSTEYVKLVTKDMPASTKGDIKSVVDSLINDIDKVINGLGEKSEPKSKAKVTEIAAEDLPAGIKKALDEFLAGRK